MNAEPRREANRKAKERRILDAALKVFSADGYSGASMEAIAVTAGVSKPTLYQYFGGKEPLFAAIMLEKRDEMAGVLERPSASMVADLLQFARAYAAVVMRPDMLSLARLIIGEAQRFPEIGRAYQAMGPDRLLARIMAYLSQRRAEERLIFEDAELAAQDLWGLILSAPRTQALYMPDAIPGPEALARSILNGLTVFLRAYSADPTTDLADLSARTRGET
jgi:TetR/AcrR family transcriptional regulator, mexJK operon transcriptional repressor